MAGVLRVSEGCHRNLNQNVQKNILQNDKDHKILVLQDRKT